MGSNESGYLSLSNGESNALCGSSKASSIWGDKSLWNLSNSPNSTSSMQMTNGDGKDSFWHSSTSSPISTPSQFNHHNSVWGCSPIKEDDSLGSIWNIPKQQQQDGNFEAPLPPHTNYIQKAQPQLLRPQEIGGSTWSGMNNNNNNNNNNNCHQNNSNIVKMKEPVGALWAHPTPPNMQLNLQTQNYNLLQSSNSKFQSPMKPMGAIHSNGLNCNNNNNIQMGGNISVNNSTSASNMQLFSDEFLSYLNMIN